MKTTYFKFITQKTDEGKTILVKGAKTDMQMDALDTLAMRLFVAGNIGTGYEQYK